MKILLLGATGRTGKLVLKKALENGYLVHCLSRNIERIKKQNGLTIFEGDPNEKTDLEKAIDGCDYVISVLNVSRKSDFPWSGLRTPEKYVSGVMSKLIPIAQEKHIKRIVVCSAWGVAETKNDIPKWFNWFIENSNIGAAYRDHERQEDIIARSTLDWTIVRPVGLSNSKKVEIIKETMNNEPKPSLMISRQSVANYLVDSLTNKALIRKMVVISKGVTNPTLEIKD